MDPVTGSLIGAGLKGLMGILGLRGQPTPRKNILSQAAGAREAAEKYGFNPLTMLQYGQSGGAMGGGGALASSDLLLGALQDVSEVVSGETAQRAAANQLELDLAKIKLDELRRGVIPSAPSAAAAVGSGPLPLGQRPIEVRGNVSAISSPASGITAPFSGGGIYVGGVGVAPTPGWSPAQTVEDEYGDAVSWIYGTAKAAADGGYNVGKWYKEGGGREALADLGRSVAASLPKGQTSGPFPPTWGDGSDQLGMPPEWEQDHPAQPDKASRVRNWWNGVGFGGAPLFTLFP